ncbi:M48 family metallopeptidase [Clostridium septicum]|uniref:M48 family metallopeptidase n=1 Tax=Clostridium septicum TaxID=1504 RepID=A0A9N7JJJ7_CLOSE|nr:SprT family zinc-dependent metalloprotease [Clostridium septicum]AYE32947.1 metal-dependent hydrolase [Clostridium septicum]MDU1315068.1 SprT family zinc-dependent metalloprotease [Clostridium septicum]QAS61120.1 M48 family peptidase [Clostridium septicum]UEC19539.1 M48 family metallopeptidase [Clostridium septicum]USS02400.1 M48 family metallopeptidase [Clostridium septicum]
MKFYYRDELIEFVIVYRDRKTLSIQIDMDGKVKVISPKSFHEKYILSIVETKGKWILNKLNLIKSRKNRIPSYKYINGERYLYLGEYYNLVIKKGSFNTEYANILSLGKLLEVKINSIENIRGILEKFYRYESFKIINERVEYYKRYFRIKPKQIKVKEQKRIWASCTFENKLLFNWRLSMMPIDVIDYIIIHEMCHMEYKNHSKEFWNDVYRVMPNYKEKEMWLKENGCIVNL